MGSRGGVVMERYELGKLLGQGTFAKVYHARDVETGVGVAVKVIDKNKVLKAGLMDQIKREVSVMRLVKHPNVVRLHEVMATKTKIYLVLECVKGGELFNQLRKGKLKEAAARSHFRHLVAAVGFCHQRGVYHRDLKPENLLLDEDGSLKVSDFGLSALAKTGKRDGLLHTTCGTPAYVAPEVISRKGYDGAGADVWSCGVVLFVLLAGYLPFHDSNLMEMYRKITRAEFKYPGSFPHKARALVSRILDPNPETRISIADIMEDSWYKKGFEPKPSRHENLDKELVFGPLKVSRNLSAFDIISFDLSGLFEEDVEEERRVRFTSRDPAATIVARLEEIADKRRLKVVKEDGGWVTMEASTEQGGQGVLCVDFRVFEITPSLHLVEARRVGGLSIEYRKVIEECLDTIRSP